MTTQVVTPAQVLAAQLVVELQREDGEEPDEALVAISKAKPSADLGGTNPGGGDETRAERAQDFGYVLRLIEAWLAQGVLEEWRPEESSHLTTLNNLGNAWSALGHPSAARDMYQRALTIQEREYGPDHPQVATTLNNLGNAWSALGHPSAARDMYQRALTIQEQSGAATTLRSSPRSTT